MGIFEEAKNNPFEAPSFKKKLIEVLTTNSDPIIAEQQSQHPKAAASSEYPQVEWASVCRDFDPFCPIAYFPKPSSVFLSFTKSKATTSEQLLPNDMWNLIIPHLDPKSNQPLSVVNKQICAIFKQALETIIPSLCKIPLIDTGSGRLSFTCKHEIVRLCQRANQLSPELNFTCLIMRKGLTFASLIKIGSERSIKIQQSYYAMKMLQETKKYSVEETYPILISNNIVCKDSFLKNEEETKGLLTRYKVELLSPLELFAFFILEEKTGNNSYAFASLVSPERRLVMTHLLHDEESVLYIDSHTINRQYHMESCHGKISERD